MNILTPHFRDHPHFDLLVPLRYLINNIQVDDERFAHRLCRFIPCSCPFERDIMLFGKTFHIPAFCKINPFYNEIIALRLRALSYLSDICGEDVTQYIC